MIKASLFAGKLHAVLARSWRGRIKGRDLYDYIYYLSTNTPVNLKHLEARLRQTNTLDETQDLTRDLLIQLLSDRFNTINYEEAKKDVIPFISNVTVLDIWSSNFFNDISKNLEIE